MEPIRVLHVVTTMDYGGVETLLMSIYRRIDREKIQFDFLCLNTCDNLFSEEIRRLGGRMYAVPFISKVGYFGYMKGISCFFEQHPEYQIVHSHLSPYNGLVLQQAKRACVPVRISHSHISHVKTSNMLIKCVEIYASQKIEGNSTIYFACSDDAKKEFYKKEINQKNCIVMNNAIQTERFRFDAEKRMKIRETYHVGEQFVIGHIGRFAYQKNQIMAVRVFEEYAAKNPRAVLWLIGEGQDKSSVQNYVKERNLEDKVIFMGSQSDIPAYLSAMDVFLFPSNYEGLGIVAVEAQASGLPVLASDVIPKETHLTDRIQYLPLLDTKPWVDTLEIIAAAPIGNREVYAEKIKDQGYDIDDVARKLERFYFRVNEMEKTTQPEALNWAEIWKDL